MASITQPRVASGTPTSSDPQPNTISVAWRNGWPWLMIILLLMGGLVFFAFLQGSGSTVPRTTDPFVLAIPFIAVATALERFWESVFGWYERFALATLNLAGVSAKAAAWMKGEVKNAEDVVASAAEALGLKSPNDPNYPQLWQQFQEAETRLLDAKTRITEVLKTPEYVALKKAVILIGSLIAGVAISVTAQLTLLHALGFTVPAPIDMVLTGLLIGSGPGPLHAFIGGLAELRNVVGGLAEMTRGSAIKKVAESFPQVREVRDDTADRSTRNASSGLGRPSSTTGREMPELAASGGDAIGARTGAPQPTAAITYDVASDNLRGQRQALRVLRNRR
ncbi:MAG TPA: hypothetical protein VEX13_18490 [Chloroflexia bacterium]|nr:hypothetical protein [Chloroflexia bacterium]